MTRFVLSALYSIIGSICIGNGLWMLFFASHWFKYMPVAVEDTGPLNSHFVHDLGLVFFLAGVGALWCGYKKQDCLAIHLAVTLFIGGHALIHVVEILAGTLPVTHWVIDFPLITFPALILIAITPMMLKRHSISL